MRAPVLTVFALALAAGPVLAGGFKARKASDEELAACLSDADPELRADCAEEIGSRALLDNADRLLVVAKQDAAPRVRSAAIAALEEMGAQTLAAAAEHMAVNDGDAGNRAKALSIIEKHLSEASAPAVIQAMQDSDPAIRRKATIIVGKRAFSAGEPWLVEHGVSDEDQKVVLEAWKAIVRLGNPEHRPAVHNALATGSEEVRRAIARGMRDQVLPVDKDALVGALDDANTHVVRDAAKALVELGDASVAGILRQKAEASSDEDVRKDLSSAASKLGG